jgi:hypothetical protein
MEFADAVIDVLASEPATHCACCKQELDYSVGHGRLWNAPSLDRIDSAKGYTIENTAVICIRCNTKKTDLTIQELQSLIRYMKSGHSCAS